MMRLLQILKFASVLAAVSLLAANSVALGGCSCGFDCNNDRNQGKAVLDLGFSDAVPEDLKQVVIEVDSITFRGTGVADVVVDSFTISELDLVSADTFQVDLLQYRGRNQLLVLDNLELRSGTYNQVLVKVLGGDINRSYVQEADDTLKPISVAGGVLTLPGITLASSTQAFTVEFGLAQSLQVQSSGNYLLATDGIRIENDATAAALSGRVDSSLFDSVTPCSEKPNPTEGNRVYIYSGIKQSSQTLGDVFTSRSNATVPANVLAPFAVGSLVRNSLTGGWDYVFGFLPAGDYTLAFACNTAADDPVEYNGLVVPQPTNQVYTLKLAKGQQAVCDLGTGGSC